MYQRAERGSVGEGRLKVGDVHADARAHAACPAKQTNLALGVRVGARRGQRRVGELVGEQSRGPSRFVLVDLLRGALAARLEYEAPCRLESSRAGARVAPWNANMPRPARIWFARRDRHRAISSSISPVGNILGAWKCIMSA